MKDKKEEDEIWREISKVTGKEVDLVVLNDAPASLVSKVFKTGLPLLVKDKNLFWDIYLTKTLEAEDFCEFNDGRKYWYGVEGKFGFRARYVKEVDSQERTVKFYQKIYDKDNNLVQIHEKFPEDRGHKKLKR